MQRNSYWLITILIIRKGDLEEGGFPIKHPQCFALDPLTEHGGWRGLGPTEIHSMFYTSISFKSLGPDSGTICPWEY